MAQRKLIPIQPDIELVADEAALLPHNPISRAIQRPKVPTRARMLAERQATAMQFQKDRSAFGITKTMEIHDHAAAETTASMIYAKHLERGFGDDLSAEEAQFYARMRQIIMDTSGAMTAEAAEALRRMARSGQLPTDSVENWELALRLVQEKLLGLR